MLCRIGGGLEGVRGGGGGDGGGKTKAFLCLAI